LTKKLTGFGAKPPNREIYGRVGSIGVSNNIAFENRQMEKDLEPAR
jgi:hypothetical protein